MNKKFVKLFTKCITIVGMLLFSILVVTTALFTTKVRDYHSGIMMVCFYPLPIIGVLISIAILSSKKIDSVIRRIRTEKVARFVFIWGLVTSILWIFVANVLPMWDSADLISATNLLNGTPDKYSEAQWSKGWYMERFPYQTPMVLLILFCMKIAGNNYIILFEIINCFACAFTMFLTVKLTEELFHEKRAIIISGILVATFIPIVLYCTFIYGNIICLPFALAGFLYQKRQIDANDRKTKIVYATLSIVLFALSATIKSSMSITIIAAFIIWTIVGLHRKKIIYVIIAVLPFILVKTLSFVSNNYVTNRIDVNLNNGVPKIAWITMGLGGGKEYLAEREDNMEKSNDLENPGYFDAFIWITAADEYSPELVSRESKYYLKARIKHFANDPGFMMMFLGKKFLVEWTEPTYEGFLASNWSTTSGSTGYNMAEREYTAFAPTIYYGKTHDAIVFLMDITQSLLALGALLYILYSHNSIDYKQLAVFICILGGAFLYMFWENKTQYMFPFYLFMIPYASSGLSQIHIRKPLKSLGKGHLQDEK